MVTSKNPVHFDIIKNNEDFNFIRERKDFEYLLSQIETKLIGPDLFYVICHKRNSDGNQAQNNSLLFCEHLSGLDTNQT